MNKANAPKPRDVMHKALLSGDTRTVKSLLDDGFNIHGRLPTRKGRPERETSLIDHGWELHSKTHQGRTPLQYARNRLGSFDEKRKLGKFGNITKWHGSR